MHTHCIISIMIESGIEKKFCFLFFKWNGIYAKMSINLNQNEMTLMQSTFIRKKCGMKCAKFIKQPEK